MSINPIRRRCRHTWKQRAAWFTQLGVALCDEFFCEHLMLCVRGFWIYLAWRGARLLIKFICYHRRKSCMENAEGISSFCVCSKCSAERDNKKQEFSRECCLCFTQAWLPQIIQPDWIILAKGAWWNFLNLFNEAGNKHWAPFSTVIFSWLT